MSSVIKIGQSDYSEENIIDNWAEEYAKRELEKHKNNSTLDHPDGCVTLDKLGDDVKDKMDNVSETIDSLLLSCNTADAQIRVIKNNISGIEENLNNFIDIADRIAEETNAAKTDSTSAMVAAKKANLAASEAVLKSENSNALSQEAKEVAENSVGIAEQAVLKSEASNSLSQEAKEIAENAVEIADQALFESENAAYTSRQAEGNARNALNLSKQALNTALNSNTLADNAIEIAQSVRADADSGKFDGEKGEKGDKGDKGEQGIQGIQGEKGVSGVYVGSGDMPSGYNVQIDPSGTTVIDECGGFWGLDLPLIKTITLEESVTSIDILSSAEGIELQEFSVLLFIKALGDAVESNISNCVMCLRTIGGGNYFGYKNVYSFYKEFNSFAFWHTKIYNKQFALTDLYNGYGNGNHDIPYMGFQGIIGSTPTQSSSYTAFLNEQLVDNLNIFIGSSAVSRGAIIPQGSMIFLFGR